MSKPKTHDEEILERWQASARLALCHIAERHREIADSYRSYWNAVDQINALQLKIIEADRASRPEPSL